MAGGAAWDLASAVRLGRSPPEPASPDGRQFGGVCPGGIGPIPPFATEPRPPAASAAQRAIGGTVRTRPASICTTAQPEFPPSGWPPSGPARTVFEAIDSFQHTPRPIREPAAVAGSGSRLVLELEVSLRRSVEQPKKC